MGSNFPESLKKLRIRRGLTQAELAERLGVGKSTISMYEVGAREPDFKMLEVIADFFGVSVPSLLQLKSDEEIDERKLTTVNSDGLSTLTPKQREFYEKISTMTEEELDRLEAIIRLLDGK